MANAGTRDSAGTHTPRDTPAAAAADEERRASNARWLMLSLSVVNERLLQSLRVANADAGAKSRRSQAPLERRALAVRARSAALAGAALLSWDANAAAAAGAGATRAAEGLAAGGMLAETSAALAAAAGAPAHVADAIGALRLSAAAPGGDAEARGTEAAGIVAAIDYSTFLDE
ncbi:hypothetical protein MNEG_5239 [Monoraphidium neglectum]|uniref:Uncharacterized protein n=1 Tax=Monoraphidium neglectum TaxID=145388 RepID=A0A0D2MI76_9CHLO|nr:hypothetical protein MNEG_5239 [Monoraphidium neglectum]KIZ02725.1 hypothetical protein MNEG_5239 [Monoraphidium neglectum]|eukprot:XP_013901744.1 hypothetical protein MNEG_5239 [Monoraphidium neglectum]